MKNIKIKQVNYDVNRLAARRSDGIVRVDIHKFKLKTLLCMLTKPIKSLAITTSYIWYGKNTDYR